MGLMATTIRDILYAASSYGEAYDTLCEMSGFKKEEIDDSGKVVDWEKAARVWELLADINKDEQVGLHLGEVISISMCGMVGFLMRSSRDVEQAFEVYCRYGYMVCPMIMFNYARHAESAIVELSQNAFWKNRYPRNARIGMDFSLSCTIHFIRTLSGRNIRPLRLEVEWGKCGLEHYNKLFQCDTLFGASATRIIFRPEDMMLPVITGDRSLYDMFNSILLQKKASIIQDTCSNTLRHLLVMQYRGQIPVVEEAAGKLNMTVRSLQRKLLEEGTTFRQIANEVKKDVALHLMKNDAANITQIAGILGYSDLPAFRRAFKSWTKNTPRTVKRQLKQQTA